MTSDFRQPPPSDMPPAAAPITGGAPDPLAADAAPDEDQMRDLVARTLEQWRAEPAESAVPSARAFLDRHPQVDRHPSLVLDLAVEEYCLRRDRGTPPDPATFAAQFPTVGTSLEAVLLLCRDNASAIADILAIESIKWPRADEVLCGFLILQELHRGAQSRVFLASELSLGQRLVVLKVLSVHTREASLLGQLVHPNIVPILSVHNVPLPHSNSKGETHCTVVVMPFLGCTTLSEVIRRTWGRGRRPRVVQDILKVANDGSLGQSLAGTILPDISLSPLLPYEAAIAKVIAQLSHALHFANSKGITHRDLKPSNILLSPAGCPMLMDFGVATSQNAPSPNASGTIPYMAPECLEAFLTECSLAADPKINGFTRKNASMSTDTVLRHDQRSDVFSLGVILYELLTGRLPFGSASQHSDPIDKAASLLRRQHRDPLRRNESNRDISEDLFSIVDDCLAPTIDQRPATFDLVGRRLEDFVASRGRSELQAVPGRRHFLLGACAAASIAASCAAATYLEFRERDFIGLGSEAYERGDFGRALAHFSRVAEEIPLRPPASTVASSYQDDAKNALCLFGLGQSYRMLGRSADAEREFERAVTWLTHPIILASLAYLRAQGAKRADACAINSLAFAEWPRFIHDSKAERYRDILGRLENNLGFAFVTRGEISRGHTMLLTAKTRFSPDDSANRVVWCNILDGWLRCYELGQLEGRNLLRYARELPSSPGGSQFGGLVHYTAARAMARVAMREDVPGLFAETVGSVLAAIAEGCPREVLAQDAGVRRILSEVQLPDGLFASVGRREFSLSELVLCPTRSCRL